MTPGEFEVIVNRSKPQNYCSKLRNAANFNLVKNVSRELNMNTFCKLLDKISILYNA